MRLLCFNDQYRNTIFIRQSVKSNLDLMSEELASRNVKFINFYDVVLDYILIDSFEVIGVFLLQILNQNLLSSWFDKLVQKLENKNCQLHCNWWTSLPFNHKIWISGSGGSTFKRYSGNEERVVDQWVQRNRLTHGYLERSQSQAETSETQPRIQSPGTRDEVY